MLIFHKIISLDSISEFLFNNLIKNRSINYNLKNIERTLKNQIYFRNNARNVMQILDTINYNNTYEKRKYPRRTAIEINNTCNLNCIMCNTKSAKRPPGNMDLDTFELILNQLKMIGIKNIALHTVGEPFMYKHIHELFRIIEKLDFKVNFSTNGQFPRKIYNLIYSYSELFNYIRFSIDASKKETYETIRRGANFNTLIKSLEIIHNFNKSKINYRIPIKIDSILSMTNIFEIPLFFKIYGKYCWPESINFNLLNSLSPDTKYFWEAFPFPNLIKKGIPCQFPFSSIFFTYDGKVTLCCRDYDGDLIVGDIINSSILEIWNSKNSEFIRKQNLNPDLLTINACKRCYEPYAFISELTNYFIHYLYYYYPNLPSQNFGQLILDFLKKLNNLMQINNKEILKEAILHFFYKNF